MAGGLHGSARTTPRVRAELQASKEKTNALAERYGLSRTTVTKWRARTSTADAPMGPRSPRSTVLTLIEEAMIVEFRRRTLLPLDDVMGCLKDSIPNLTRSSLHRCLERHGISRLPDSQEKASRRGKFAETTIGYVHLDHCELRLADGKLHMFLAIDRVSKFTYVEFHDRTKMLNGAAFLHSVIEAFPYRIHTGPHRQWNGLCRPPQEQERDLSPVGAEHVRSRLPCTRHRSQAQVEQPLSALIVLFYSGSGVTA